MILKIKNNGKWHYIDKIGELINEGFCLIENHKISNPQGQTFRPKFYPNDQMQPDSVFIDDRTDAIGNGECLAVTIIYDGASRKRVTVALQEAYLLNDNGKTVERLSVG